MALVFKRGSTNFLFLNPNCKIYKRFKSFEKRNSLKIARLVGKDYKKICQNKIFQKGKTNSSIYDNSKPV